MSAMGSTSGASDRLGSEATSSRPDESYNGWATYGVTVSGGVVLHTVAGDMQSHRPWRDAVTTLCGRSVVANDYFANLADYRSSYNAHGRDCPQCVRVATSGMLMSL